MSSEAKKAGLSLPLKVRVNLTLSIVFTLVLVVTLSVITYNERKAFENAAKQQVQALATSYFDSLNTMMLTGTIANRNLLRDKLLAREEIHTMRMVRGNAINKQFGDGPADERPVDEYDRRGLKGEAIQLVKKVGDERVLTVVQPIPAVKDWHGTNCLLCHVVDENSIVGAVRIDYSLASMDAEAERNLYTNGIVQVVLFTLGLAIISVLMGRSVTKPIGTMKSTMERIESNSDLRERVALKSNDEIGSTGHAFNRMMDRVRDLITQVGISTHELENVAKQMSGITDATRSGVQRQRDETDQLATAINQMAATSQEVARNASDAATATAQTDDEANRGSDLSRMAVTRINALTNELGNTADTIQSLAGESDRIGGVLDVIRAIADQTNLLALNAAIEAARAGEQGRGFAVVAEEVRTLAQRTQDSTAEIHDMIEKLQTEAQKAVQVMERAGEEASQTVEHVTQTEQALSTIVTGISTIHEMNTQIATAVEEQSAVAEEINRNITAISQVAEETSEGAQQTASASDNLNSLANDLTAQVDLFQV